MIILSFIIFYIILHYYYYNVTHILSKNIISIGTYIILGKKSSVSFYSPNLHCVILVYTRISQQNFNLFSLCKLNLYLLCLKHFV